MKKAGIIGILAAVLLLGGVWLSNNAKEASGAIISRNGIHWHPTLEIYVRGEKQSIPANIGLIGGHNPMHTHDSDGVVHLEYEGLVGENDIRLGTFFRLWGKEFNATQLFDNHNSEEVRVHMFVNGEEDTEFENYLMRDRDKIEIRYE